MKKAAMVLCVLFAVGSVSMGCAKSKEDQVKAFCADMLKASAKTDCKAMAKDLAKLKKDGEKLEKLMGDDSAKEDPKVMEAAAQCIAAAMAIAMGPCSGDEDVQKAMD
ncbi:MAG: hypothetical protein FWC40_06435 [Proteobacteria bacterium]|nr:hypothetical protein [Pseudomonadota bacterium]